MNNLLNQLNNMINISSFLDKTVILKFQLLGMTIYKIKEKSYMHHRRTSEKSFAASIRLTFS